MKKFMVALVGVLMLAVTTTAFADTTLTVGVKAWANNWDTKVEDTNGTKISEQDFGDAVMAGPSLNLRLGDHFFIGANYLKAMKDYESNHWAAPTAADTVAIERTDVDVTMGVMFTRHFGMFVGYKNIDAPLKYTYPALGISDQNIGKFTMKGPGIGLLASIPLGSSAAIYGNLAVMKIEDQFTNAAGVASPANDKTGGSLELGLAIAFGDHFSSTLGYKVQVFSGELNNSTDVETHTFKGATVGLNLIF